MSVPGIKSKLAVINDRGKLMCKLCNMELKSEKVWIAHVSGRVHRENIQQLKQRGTVSVKRPTPSTTEPSTSKRSKVEDSDGSENGGSNLPNDFFDNSGQQKPSSTSIPSKNSTSSSESNNGLKSVADSSSSATTTAEKLSELEASGPWEQERRAMKEKAEEMEQGEKPIPEGFFDDREKDAKARGEEPKDPMDEEWAKFQKEMKQAEHDSEQIKAEFEDAEQNRREIEEIEEQIAQWSRVNDIQKKKEDIIAKGLLKRKEEENERSAGLNDSNCDGLNDVDDNADGSEDDVDEMDLLDWRSKGI